MRNFHQLKHATEVVIDGILVNAISKKLIINTEKIFNI